MTIPMRAAGQENLSLMATFDEDGLLMSVRDFATNDRTALIAAVGISPFAFFWWEEQLNH